MFQLPWIYLWLLLMLIIAGALYKIKESVMPRSIDFVITKNNIQAIKGVPIIEPYIASGFFWAAMILPISFLLIDRVGYLDKLVIIIPLIILAICLFLGNLMSRENSCFSDGAIMYGLGASIIGLGGFDKSFGLTQRSSYDLHIQ